MNLWDSPDSVCPTARLGLQQQTWWIASKTPCFGLTSPDTGKSLAGLLSPESDYLVLAVDGLVSPGSDRTAKSKQGQD